MPWYEFSNLEVIAEADGTISVQREITTPISGRILMYKLKTKEACLGRTHSTTLTIQQIDDDGQPIGDPCESGPVPIEDCMETVVPFHCEISEGRYEVVLKSDGFSSHEVVNVDAAVRYSLFLSDRTAGWERQPEAENAAKDYIGANLPGHHQIEDYWGNEKWCGSLYGWQNHGHWKNDDCLIQPDYNSLEIWIDRQTGRARGSMRINFIGRFHHKKYDCGRKYWEYQPTAYAHTNIAMNIDLSSGQADVTLEAHFHLDEVTSCPSWLDDIAQVAVRFVADSKFQDVKPGLEQRIEDAINSSHNAENRIVEIEPSLLTAVGLEEVLDDSDTYLAFLEDCVLERINAQMLDIREELDPEFVARTLNAESFDTHIDRIDTDEGIYFADIDIRLKPTVLPGQVRVFTAPQIKLVFDGAHFGNDQVTGVTMRGTTNLFSGGTFSVDANLALTANHTYEADKVEFDDLHVSHLDLHEAPGFSEFMRRKMNQHLPDKIRNDDGLLRAIASSLNDAIRDILGRVTAPFLAADDVREQCTCPFAEMPKTGVSQGSC